AWPSGQFWQRSRRRLTVSTPSAAIATNADGLSAPRQPGRRSTPLASAGPSSAAGWYLQTNSSVRASPRPASAATCASRFARLSSPLKAPVGQVCRHSPHFTQRSVLWLIGGPVIAPVGQCATQLSHVEV